MFDRIISISNIVVCCPHTNVWGEMEKMDVQQHHPRANRNKRQPELHICACMHVCIMYVHDLVITFATAFGGYSPPSLESMHCLTLSSLSFGVA